MNLCVCVKQVPDTQEIRVDQERHTLIRAGVPAVMNPFDAWALEAAVQLKGAAGGSVTVCSMGPQQAKMMLQDTLAVGADAAYLICDPAFGGSDTLATGYILSRAIRRIEVRSGETFDLILCGRQATDGDTAQVGAILAEFLGVPQISCACEFQILSQGICALQEQDALTVRIAAPLPALVTVSGICTAPRIPTLRMRLTAKKKEIPVLCAQDLPELDLSRCGLSGSPTRVISTYVPKRSKHGLTGDVQTVLPELKKTLAQVKAEL